MRPAFQPHSRFAGARALQVGVGEGGVFLGHRAEALDGLHQVFLIDVLEGSQSEVRRFGAIRC